jgi:hypothetical protein
MPNNTTQPKYTNAMPFDFIRDFQALQKQVKALQVSNSGPCGPWNDVAALSNGWGFTGSGQLQWRTTGNLGVQIVCYRILPGTLTDGTVVFTGLPASATQKEWPVAVDHTPTNSARFVYTTGGALVCDGLAAGTGDVSFLVTVPLDI